MMYSKNICDEYFKAAWVYLEQIKFTCMLALPAYTSDFIGKFDIPYTMQV